MDVSVSSIVSGLRRRRAIEHFSITVLGIQALIALAYRLEINNSYGRLISGQPFGNYDMDGRLLWPLGLFLIGLIIYVSKPRVTPFVLALHVFWAWGLDGIIKSSIGGLNFWTDAPLRSDYFLDLLILRDTLILVTVAVFVAFAIWAATRAYRAKVSEWIDVRGQEVAKNAADYEHTSTLAIIALVLAFIFPVGGLILASVAKREIALGRRKMGGLDLIVAANVVSVALIIMYALLVISWVVFVVSFPVALTTQF